MPETDLPGVPNCVRHPGRDSVDSCEVCGAAICSECVVIFDALDLCPDCAASRRAALTRDLAAAEEDLRRAEGAARGYVGAVSDDAYRAIEERCAALTARIERLRRTLGA